MNRKYRRIYDLVNIREWEVKASILIVLLTAIGLMRFDFYNKFSFYEESIKDLFLCLIGAMIGLLGFSLSGIAIIVGLFSKEEEGLIAELNGSGKIKVILSSYSFLALNIGLQCVAVILLYLAISAGISICNECVFWIITVLETYHIVFILSYTIALVMNCVKLYEIKNLYGEINKEKKSIHDLSNEIKIDYIFSTLVNICDFSQDEVIEKLIVFVENSDIANKEKVISYLRNQYNK